MLKNYLQMLENAFKAMTSLGGSNATWMDYFHTVGYEFLVLAIGILYLVGMVLLITVPTVGCVKIWKNPNNVWGRHLKDVDECNKFLRIYRIKWEALQDKQLNNDYRYTLYTELVDLLKSKHIPIEKFIPSSEWTKEMAKSLPCLQYAIDDTEDGKFPGDLAYVTNPGKYKSFVIMKYFVLTRKVLGIASLLLVYSMFVIPLILMFIR